MSESRWRFTLISLLVVVLVIGVVLALFFSWAPRARELVRRSECGHQQSHLTIAIQTYHENRGEFPPLATDDDAWSWAMLLTPYLQTTAFKSVVLNSPTSPKALPLVLQYRNGVFLCPTRAAERMECRIGPFRGAQPTDFVPVSTADWNLKWSNASDGVIVFRRSPPTPTSAARSGITFDNVVDGLSATAIFGEKHMLPDWLDGPLDEPALIAKKGPLLERLAGVRAGNRGLAKDPLDPDEWKFGSWHTGVVNFAMCDGSVRQLSVDTDLKVLSLLTCRNDSKRLGEAELDVAPLDDPLAAP